MVSFEGSLRASQARRTLRAATTAHPNVLTVLVSVRVTDNKAMLFPLFKPVSLSQSQSQSKSRKPLNPKQRASDRCGYLLRAFSVAPCAQAPWRCAQNPSPRPGAPRACSPPERPPPNLLGRNHVVPRTERRTERDFDCRGQAVVEVVTVPRATAETLVI